ncbi:MAG: PIN domain-containing protein [bacterium]
MKNTILLDTGPLVAFLDRREAHHEWVRCEFGKLCPPLMTCEAVLAEACWLVRGLAGGVRAVMDLVERGIVTVPFHLEPQVTALRKDMERYRDLPMSLADACLVRMAELHPGAEVFTLDSHFKIYRLSNRKVIPVRMP